MENPNVDNEQPLTNTDRTRLEGLSLVSRLPSSERELALSAARTRNFAAGEFVVREGEQGNAFYVILEGHADVHVLTDDGEEVPLQSLEPGRWFGEQALLRGPDALRTASVRARDTLRCAIIPRAAFKASIAHDTANVRLFDADSVEQLQHRLVSSLAVFRGLDLSERLTDKVSRQPYKKGTRLFTRGDVADAVYFVLDGIVAVWREEQGLPEELALIGPGQCFGEVGVIHQAPRGASAVARTNVELLRIEHDTFRRWHGEHPQLRDFLGTLQQIYKRSDGRPLSVYRGEVEGSPSISTVCGDPAGDCIISTRVIGQDLMVLARGGPDSVPERTEIFYDAGSGARRELRLGSQSAEVTGFVARKIGPDVSELCRHVFDRIRISNAGLARFRRTGHLGGEVDLRDPFRVCSCMRLSRADVRRAAKEHGSSVEAVRAATGASALCGACEPDICSAIANLNEIEAANTSFALADAAAGSAPPVVRRPEIQFDAAALEKLRGIPEIRFMAAASVFATTGERFMIRAVSRAMPYIRDANLLDHARAFLTQESNHVALHAPLNVLLVGRVFPDSRALRALGGGVFQNLHRLPLRLSLAVSAAFEHIADQSFGVFFEHYYRNRERRFHPDPRIHELAIRSGLTDLFLWHGVEELSHRHVAFEVMRALRTSYVVRSLGFLILASILIVGIIPALISLSFNATRRIAAVPRHIGIIVAWRSLKFLRPRFHPAHAHYAFLQNLQDDTRHYPLA